RTVRLPCSDARPAMFFGKLPDEPPGPSPSRLALDALTAHLRPALQICVQHSGLNGVAAEGVRGSTAKSEGAVVSAEPLGRDQDTTVEAPGHRLRRKTE